MPVLGVLWADDMNHVLADRLELGSGGGEGATADNDLPVLLYPGFQQLRRFLAAEPGDLISCVRHRWLIEAARTHREDV